MQAGTTRRVSGRSCVMAALVAIGVTAGCEKGSSDNAPKAQTPEPPAMTTQPTSAAVTPAATSRPTTQQLVSGKRKTIVLGTFPLRLEVPESWKLVTANTATFLQGDAPHGEVRIQLVSQGNFIKPDSVAAMEKRARDKAAADPANLEVTPLHSIGATAKAMERREFLRGLTVRRDDGKEDRINSVDWSIIVFVPQDRDFGINVLNFMGLSMEQYQQDKEFLDGVLRTLRYDAAGGALD